MFCLKKILFRRCFYQELRETLCSEWYICVFRIAWIYFAPRLLLLRPQAPPAPPPDVPPQKNLHSRGNKKPAYCTSRFLALSKWEVTAIDYDQAGWVSSLFPIGHQEAILRLPGGGMAMHFYIATRIRIKPHPLITFSGNLFWWDGPLNYHSSQEFV